MTHVLFAVLYLVQLAQGIDATSVDICPPLDETSRSVSNILGACALTLLICIWHTVHFNVPRDRVEASLWFRGLCAFVTFLAPEVIVAYASREWWKARKQVKRFHRKGYKWSMTHSFFAEMGGFRYRNELGNLETINSRRFLKLCKERKITNPFITVQEIRDKSKSDWLGKAILALQLMWFMLQVVVRGSKGLAITLVELDTVCMAILSLIVIVLWWNKPLRPECPHVFYSTHKVNREESRMYTRTSHRGSMLAEDRQQMALRNAWRPEPFLPDWVTAYFRHTHKSSDEIYGIVEHQHLPIISKVFELFRAMKWDDKDIFTVTFTSLSATWLILGSLHLIAWDYEFPTEVEKNTWRLASLVLAGGSLVFLIVRVPIEVVSMYGNVPSWMVIEVGYILWPLLGISSIVSRTLLVGLMLASLRALPCSAHLTVPWTLYIPHL